MKINRQLVLLLITILLGHINSASFGFGMMKKSANRNHASNSYSKSNSSTNTRSNMRARTNRQTNTHYFAVSTAITKSKTVTSTSGSTTSSTTRSGDIPDYSLYYDGWVKYLHFVDTTSKPKAFFKNTRYAPETRAHFSGPDADKVK